MSTLTEDSQDKLGWVYPGTPDDTPTDFLSLPDTPDSYVGQGSKAVTVKTDETGLEFTTAGGGGSLTAKFLTATSDPTLTNEVNLGALASGFLKQSVSGGVSTPYISQAGFTVNVKDPPYNAVGDGVADDTTAIQTAITAVFNAGGGTIYFPKGTYLVNGAFDGTTNSILKIPFNDPTTTGVISIKLQGEVQAPGVTNLGTATIPGGSIIKSTKAGTGTRPAILAGAAYMGSPSVSDFNPAFLIINGLTFRTYDNPTIDALRLQRIGRVSLEDVAVDTGVRIPTIAPTGGTVGISMPATGNFAQNVCNRVAIQGYDVGLLTGEHFTSVYTIIAYCNKGLQINGANDQGAVGNLVIVWCPRFVNYGGAASVDLNLDLERSVAGPWYATVFDIDGITSFNYGSGVIRYALSDNTGRIAGPLNVNAPGDCQFIDLFNGRMRWNGDVGLQRDSAIGGALWITDGAASPAFRDLTVRQLFLNATDTAIARNAAGVVEINSGVAGTFRDLKARTLLPQAGTATVAPVLYTSGTNLTTAAAGTREFDGVQHYGTIDTTSGRGAIPVEQYFRLNAAGGVITTIANFFGSTSNISLVASAFYEIEIYCFFLKDGSASVLTWTFTNSAAPTGQNIISTFSPIAGIVTGTPTATNLEGQIYNDATAAKTIATGTLAASVNHFAHFKIMLKNGTGTSLKIQATVTTGNITPGIGSWWRCRRISPNNIGTFVA